MVRIATLALLAVLLALVSCSPKEGEAEKQAQEGEKAASAAVYVPKAQYCVVQGIGSPFCSIIPGNIGPDPILDQKIAYNGIIGSRPTSANNDAQTPFDNLSWQTFVALNWTLGKESQPPAQGLQGSGPRVWEGWPRVSDIFGNGQVQANCSAPPAGVRVFSIASNGKGQPVAQNEEYIQAATNDPLIDVSGNWTVYERRLNSVEVAYLRAPYGNIAWNLTTLQGQKNLVAAGRKVDFPAQGSTGNPPTGAIEIKAAWRVLDPANRVQNQKKYYVVPALLKVAPDLVTQKTPICAQVDMGLVAMHIIQKNPLTNNSLKPEWFWSTFEHVDNAPLAKNACDPADPGACSWFNNLNCTANLVDPGASYSYFNRACPGCPVNQEPKAASSNPQYAWNSTAPFAKGYMIPGNGAMLGTQVSRCWNIYSLTNELNSQWRGQLAQIGSVFQNYMLVGTQWGASLTDTPNPKYPSNAVPSLLSNTVVETYLQTLYDPKNPFGTGSCVSCHSQATLPGTSVSSNLSFLPYLARPGLVREEPAKMFGRARQEQEAAQKPQAP